RAAPNDAVHFGDVFRLVWRVRVAVIDNGIAEIKERAAVKLIGARLGENLDASVSQLVVLGGEGVLVDADLADRLLRGQAAAGKAVDTDLPAVRPRGWAGELLQVARDAVG